MSDVADPAKNKTASVAAASETSLLELGASRFEPGCWQGMRQPAMLVPLQLTRLEISASALLRFDAALAEACPTRAVELSRTINAMSSEHPVLGRMLRMTLAILENMGMPVMAGAKAIKPEAQNPRQWVVGLPAISESIPAPQGVFALACGLMNALAAGKDVRPDALAAQINKLAEQFRPMAPRGVNTLPFLQAAHEMGIPWRHVVNNVYQFGWGARSRWLDSSFTDQTSAISTGLARDKVTCVKVLRDAGLPVPMHQLVATAEQAVAVAEALGYPVVLKPSNLDGGAGVLVGLRDAQAVTQAFVATAKLSKRILVEQLIQGSDYRIRVCEGEVIGVVIRKAAAVTGDGEKSVRVLMDDINRQRAKMNQPLDPNVELGSKPIVVDDEVHQWLAAQGLTLDSVIPSGQRVRLRGAANVNLGGTTWDVTHEAHPDNLALAVHAASALRLDVAGVDLLLPDIARSWKETGGAVCEVNAQPQLSSSPAHSRVLERLVRHQGRIPVFAIQWPDPDPGPIETLVRELKLEGIRVRIASTTRECQQALCCTDVDALIWRMDLLPSPLIAMPVDRLDLVFHSSGPSDPPGWMPLAAGAAWKPWDPADAEREVRRLLTYLREALQHASAA